MRRNKLAGISSFHRAQHSMVHGDIYHALMKWDRQSANKGETGSSIIGTGTTSFSIPSKRLLRTL